ncbi:hypothetical protein AVEN_250864-1 [Araneus ventricosus]|uniref:Uncharacterized protein n=1 Tax=Araneus ventricosus TaxID=182803 RepID=A0A4Y2INE5_ARAVE|nr:hypothetical protein AVEN_250864-1 [Araneus ventricosus]
MEHHHRISLSLCYFQHLGRIVLSIDPFHKSSDLTLCDYLCGGILEVECVPQKTAIIGRCHPPTCVCHASRKVAQCCARCRAKSDSCAVE